LAERAPAGRSINEQIWGGRIGAGFAAKRGVNGFVCSVERDSGAIAPATAVIAFGPNLH